MQQSIYQHDGALHLPETRSVSLTAPFRWIKAGWSDYRQNMMSSSFYGLVFVLLGYAVTAATWQFPILVLTFITGFFLLAPFMGLGLYDISRQQEQGEQVSFRHSLLAFRHNKMDIGLLMVFHFILMIAWIRLATLIGALYFGHSNTSVTVLFERLLTSGEGIEMLAVFTLGGAIFAATVFLTSAISWPMILERRDGVIQAMATSMRVVMKNKATMLLWAALIGGLFLIGLATFYIGLIAIIPILGHATWHAYKELVS